MQQSLAYPLHHQPARYQAEARRAGASNARDETLLWLRYR
jgi:hypothetical protein